MVKVMDELFKDGLPKEMSVNELGISARRKAEEMGDKPWFAFHRFETASGVQSSLGAWTKGHPKYSEVNLPEYNTSSLQLATELPTDFDPKTQWPKCSVIGLVRNQAGCGSCWAFGATESFEGSRCVATGADIEFSKTRSQRGWTSRTYLRCKTMIS